MQDMESMTFSSILEKSPANYFSGGVVLALELGWSNASPRRLLRGH